MLPHVVRWNGEVVGEPLRRAPATPSETTAGHAGDGWRAAGRPARALARLGGLPSTLGELGVSLAELPALAADAATQWTGTFNPRPFGVRPRSRYMNGYLNSRTRTVQGASVQYGSGAGSAVLGSDLNRAPERHLELT